MKPAAGAGDLRAPEHEVDEDTLRRCIRGGDPAAAYTFVKFYEERLLTFLATRWSSPDTRREDLEDLAQESFRRAFCTFHTFVPHADGRDGKVSSWLFEIAKNAAIDQYRQRKRRIETVPFTAVKPSHSAFTFQRDSESRERLAALNEAMDKLSAQHREVLVLSVREGKSHKYIAQLCGITENTVKSRLNRARAALRRHLKGDIDEDEG